MYLILIVVLKNGVIKAGEVILLIRELYFESGLDKLGNKKRFSSIDAIADLTKNFHQHSFF